MTLYRHFASKDELVAEYLRRLAGEAKTAWDRRDAEHPGEPRAQLRAWLEDMAGHVADSDGARLRAGERRRRTARTRTIRRGA